MLLLEYLHDYSNPFSLLHVLRLFPNTAVNITKIGKAILDNLYWLQEQCPTTYMPLSPDDISATPGQPQSVSVLTQLANVKSISTEAKVVLQSRINLIVNNQVPVRRSSQLGIRNIMMRRSNIAFIDREYMQTMGLSIYDASYLVITLLMRTAHFFISRTSLNMISTSLFIISDSSKSGWQRLGISNSPRTVYVLRRLWV
jgi:hypothetical protein